MNYFHKPSSSSAPSSSSSSPSDVNAGNSVKDRGIIQSFTQRRLTRQRKLRHVSEQDIGLQGSPDSSRKSPSPGESEHWSISAVPQPLPLPELPSSRRPESTALNSGQAHLGSPQELGRKSIDNVATISVKPTSDHHSRFSQDVHKEFTRYNLRLNIPSRTSLPCDFSSPVSPQRPKKTREFLPSSVTTSSAKSPDNFFRGFSQDVNAERGNYNLRLKAPARSAPTSVFSSPAASPRRLNSGDLFPSSAAFQEFQDSLVGFASKVSPAKTMHSPDLSPKCSPTVSSPLLTPKSPKRTAFQSHQSFMEWPEISAYPLPLPPGVTLPSQSSTQSQSTTTHHPGVTLPSQSSMQSQSTTTHHPGVTLPSQSSMQSQSTTTHHVTEHQRASSFKGQWQKGKRIGRGTFGTVYLATNLETGAYCAMKEVDLIPDDPKSAECVKQLEQEIKVLHQLNHPNIVQYYGSEIVDDHFYIYLEYIHPGSIDKYVHEHFGAITESIVRNFTRHILSGLAYLHSKKTIHRDIKGANLLVDASGVVKLTDFGLAKHLAGQSYNLSLKGSPYWMAPEVMQAAMQNDPNPDLALAVDIWSLGCTIIEMLNGKPPWSDFTGPQAMFKVLNRSPPIPETLSPEGKDFLRCCFRRNPAERPTASKLLDHPFVRNSHDQNVSLCVQTFSAVNLTDKRHTAGDGTKHKDPMSVSAGTRSTNGNLPCSCGYFQHYNSKISSSTEAFHHPHCSMLQVRPSQSITQLIHGSHSCSPSNISSNVPLGRTHGREVSNH